MVGLVWEWGHGPWHRGINNLSRLRQPKKEMLPSAWSAAAREHPPGAVLVSEAAQGMDGQRPHTCIYSQSCWERCWVSGTSAKCCEGLKSKVMHINKSASSYPQHLTPH